LIREGKIKGKKKEIGWKWLVRKEEVEKYKEKRENVFDFQKFSFSFLKYASLVFLIGLILSVFYFSQVNKP
jgi:hypothetical protein